MVFQTSLILFQLGLRIAYHLHRRQYQTKLEQLEHLRSEIPPAAPWLPILVIHIRSKVKTRQSLSYKFEKIAKYWNFKILHKNFHTTHLLKLLGKMYKYEMDPTRTVGATEWIYDAGQTRGRQTDGRSETNIPPTTLLCRGYNNTSTLLRKMFDWDLFPAEWHSLCCSSGVWTQSSEYQITWWRHQMETFFSMLLALCEVNPLATGVFPSQMTAAWSFDDIFDLCLNKQLSKQWRCWWFEMPLHSLWRQCNE